MVVLVMQVMPLVLKALEPLIVSTFVHIADFIDLVRVVVDTVVLIVIPVKISETIVLLQIKLDSEVLKEDEPLVH